MKYPRQILSLKRPETVLGIDAYLSAPTEESPLELHDGFSRFVVAIVDTKQGCQPAANIPARDLPGIQFRAKHALNKYYEVQGIEPEGDTEVVSSAYTEKIFLKPFSGKTPAEILIENPANKAELERIRDEVLVKNAAKYAANRKQITAINEAIDLLNSGNLTGKDIKVNKTKPFIIYSADHKFKSTKNEKGYNLVYSINITCDVTRNYPFIVTITNLFAPVETLPDGTKNVVLAKAEDKKVAQFRMTDAEFASMVGIMSTVKSSFEKMIFKTQYEIAEANSYKHKEKK